MAKDFDLWNVDKKLIDLKKILFYFKEREVWWCSLGINVGYEADGKNKHFVRPVLILKTFGNGTCWILPLTSVNKSNPYYYECVITGASKKSYIVLSQIKLISNKRLIKKMGMIPRQDFEKVKDEVVRILGK